MGIEIDRKKVSFCATHNRLVNTSIKTNPTLLVKNGSTISFIYKREKNKTKRKHATVVPGDGNQLISALKKKKGFRISSRELNKFVPSFSTILSKTVARKNYDLIVYIPSRFTIGKVVANRVQRQIPNSRIEHIAFNKSTVEEILNNLQTCNIEQKDKQSVGAASSRLSQLDRKQYFPLSDIDVSIRKYFIPVSNISTNCTGEYILIVDDLYATGTTMSNAIDLVRSINPKATIEGLCLFSPL